MEQSIARSQANVSAAERPDKSWKSLVAGIGSALMAAKLKITSSTWLLRNPLGTDISSDPAVDRIAARLAVDDRARSEGQSEQPPASEEVIAGTQGEIVHYFQQMQTRARDQIARMLQKVRGAGKELDWLEAFNYLRDIPSRCQNDVLRVMAESESNLDFLWEREVQQRQHYEVFKRENKLSRVAKPTGSPLVHFAFMVAVFAAAVFALAYSPIAGPDGFVAVSSSWIVSISLLAVVVPYFIGASVFRSINHLDAFERLTAWLAGIMTMGFIGGLAFFCANYFLGVAAGIDLTISGVVRDMLTEPGAIGADLIAWRGFGIVSLAGLLAFMVGYVSDDPYPEYGAVQRAYYQARKERERRTNRLRKRINSIVDVAEVEITEAIRVMKARTKRFADRVDQSKSMQAQLGDFESALEDSCNLLLDRYRAANESARRTAVPMSFSEHICFPSAADQTPSELRHSEARLEEIEREMAEFEEKSAAIRQDLRDLNSRAINELERTPGPEHSHHGAATGVTADDS